MAENQLFKIVTNKVDIKKEQEVTHLITSVNSTSFNFDIAPKPRTSNSAAKQSSTQKSVGVSE